MPGDVLTGLAAIITALTGMVSVILTGYVLIRVNRVDGRVAEVHDLTNSNFSHMQETLTKVLDTSAIERREAISAAERAAPHLTVPVAPVDPLSPVQPIGEHKE